MSPAGKLPKSLKLSARAARLGIRVRRLKNASRGEAYGHSWLVTVPAKVTGGSRIRRQFTVSESREAINFAEGEALKSREQGQSAFHLTPEQVTDARRALKLLHGVDISLVEAARYAVRHLRPEGGDITFAQLRDRILREKEREGLRPASLKALRFYFAALIDHFGADALVKSASYDELRRWADAFADTGAGKRHVRNFVRYARQFFAYALAHKFAGQNVAAELKAPRLDAKTPVVLTLPEVKRLLAAARLPDHADLLPAVVLALFCGLRTEELFRLRWEHIYLAERKIAVTAEVSKNRDPRYPEIPPGAVEFLLLHADRTGKLAPTRFGNRLTALHKAAGFATWKKTHANAKRHSFGSYACKLHDWEWVVTTMGNSVEMLKKHYRDANVTREQAEEYFTLTPATVGEIAPAVPFAPAASKTA